MAVISEAAIRELAGIRGDVAPITSCYLDVDGRRLVRHQDVEHELDGVLRGARHRANGHRSVHDDLKRIEAYVKGGIDRHSTRGLAIFSCAATDLWEVIELPKPVRSCLVINHAPAVGQLESMVQEHEPIGVLLADKQMARLYVFELGVLVDRSELIDELPRDYDSRGERERGTPAHHRAELAHQHLRNASRAAFDLWQARGFHHLAIGASDPIAGELEQILHPYLRDRLCGRVALGVGASPAEVLAAAEVLEADVERAREAALVDRLKQAAATGGRGVAGLADTLVALSERRAERLVVSKGFAQEGWRAPDGALALVGPTHPQSGARMERVTDVVEDALEEALTQGIPVTICVGNADLDVLGRIGALLRDRHLASLGHAVAVLAVGLDVGGTKVLGVAIDTRDPTTIIAEGRVPTPDGGDGLVDTLLELIDSLGPTPEAVGVGVPGLVDRSGTLHMGPHLRRMHEVPLGRLLGERSGVPTVVDNDANCHAVGEQAAGAATGAADALVVTLGTGIGAGIITGGHLLRGANGFAGEPGHMIVDPNGPPCPCGKRGCWERFASGTGLGRLARDAASGGRLDAAVALAGGDPEAVRGEHVTASARAGDADSQAVLDALARWIALGLANLTNVLDPAIIVIGGGLVEAADLLLPEVRTRFAALVLAGDQRPAVPIVPAILGERAGAIGAALLSGAPLRGAGLRPSG